MSFHAQLPTKHQTDLARWSMAVALWRGHCLELFSRMEVAISNCVGALESAGIALTCDANHPGAVARLRALESALKENQFEGHERKALKRLEECSELWHERLWLAHGRMKIIPAGISVSLRSHDGRGASDHPLRRVTALEMLDILIRLDIAQIALAKQLGQVCAAARRAPRP